MEAKAAGVTAFCSKPMFLSDLRETLMSALGQNQTDAAQELLPQKNADFKGRQILLVEDNELNREIAVEILKEAGFEVESAEDGEIAVRKMKQAADGQYDLILMDIQMPNMDGYQAAKLIRNLSGNYRTIPIIAMTANAFDEDRQKALSVGMDAHLAKPVDVKRLFGTLRKVIR